MVWRDVLLVFAPLIAAASFIVALMTYRRFANWRESDAGKKVTDELAAMGKRVSDNLADIDGRVQLLDAEVQGLPTTTALSALNDRMVRVETRLEEMPSKADLATLREGQRALERISQSNGAGIARIENWLMDAKS